MKFKQITIFSIIILLSIESSFGQAFYDTSNYYDEPIIQGDSINGVRIGKWIESSPSGILYSETHYDSLGTPVGSSIINTSKGKKRFETDYNKGKVISCRIFRKNQKLIEIISNDFLSIELYNEIRQFEDSEYSTPIKNVHIGGTGKVMTFNRNHFNYFIQLIDKLKNENFSGLFIGYDDFENIRREYDFNNGNYKKTIFVYSSSGKKLKEERVYDNEILIRTNFFNRKGEITKTIE